MKQISIALAISLILMLSMTACENATTGSVDPVQEQIETTTTERTSNVTIQSEYHTEEIHCTNEGEDIYGVAYIPDTDDEKYPLVIFSHELDNTHTSGTHYAEALASQGIAFYTFDYRNGSSASRSGNDMSKMSVMTEVSDLEAVIGAAKHGILSMLIKSF